MVAGSDLGSLDFHFSRGRACVIGKGRSSAWSFTRCQANASDPSYEKERWNLSSALSVQPGFLLVMARVAGKIGYFAAYAATDDFNAAFPKTAREQLQAAEISV